MWTAFPSSSPYNEAIGDRTIPAPGIGTATETAVLAATPPRFRASSSSSQNESIKIHLACQLWTWKEQAAAVAPSLHWHVRPHTSEQNIPQDCMQK